MTLGSELITRRRLVALAVGAICCAAPLHGQTIIDNADPEFSVMSGSWSTGSYGEPWGADYRWTSTTGGSPTASVEWRPVLDEAGWYNVAVYYVDGTNRADDAPYTVHHADGSDTFLVNQQVGVLAILDEVAVGVGVARVHEDQVVPLQAEADRPIVDVDRRERDDLDAVLLIDRLDAVVRAAGSRRP